MKPPLAQRNPLHPLILRSALYGSIVERFTFWATVAPDSLAVADDRHSFTYAQLSQRAASLLTGLQRNDVLRQDIVALRMNRSVDFVVAALAVMSAGAAYLPLDAATPHARVRKILDDSGAALLLTDESQASGLPQLPIPILAVDGFSIAAAPPEVSSDEPAQPAAEELAYLIYTSGSTGKPKGVEINHRSLAQLIAWHRTAFSLVPEDRVSQVAGLGFDAAVWEIWPALAAGASVHFAGERTRRVPQALRDWLVEQRINVSFAPTHLAEQLLELTWPSKTALRTLLTGAETLRRRPAAGLPFTLVNNYGPTECTVVATSGIVEPADPFDPSQPPSIGKPIGQTVALVLDEALQPVAAGDAGELCLAGPLLAAGYRNNPALTAERFVNWSDGDRALRIYRTGDRVRQLSDGSFAFLGRRDDQVKIRGFRIELEEVAACLVTHPDVQSSVVVVENSACADSSRCDARLIAYFVAKPDSSPAEETLRAHCAAELPDYMVPQHFIELSTLPMTLNGKIDKAALPKPSSQNAPEPESLETARTADATLTPGAGVRQRIAALVAELLGEPHVDADANFFMIGGHSMFGVQLVAKIRDQFSVKLSLRQLFKAPTVDALTAEVARCLVSSQTA